MRSPTRRQRRQIVGWREFIRGMYLCKGSYSRTRNFWNFNRKIPSSFYEGSTGIAPVDQTIKRVLEMGYCHERLMICYFFPNHASVAIFLPQLRSYIRCLRLGHGTQCLWDESFLLLGMLPWEKIWDGLFWRFIGHFFQLPHHYAHAHRHVEGVFDAILWDF